MFQATNSVAGLNATLQARRASVRGTDGTAELFPLLNDECTRASGYFDWLLLLVSSSSASSSASVSD